MEEIEDDSSLVAYHRDVHGPARHEKARQLIDYMTADLLRTGTLEWWRGGRLVDAACALFKKDGIRGLIYQTGCGLGIETWLHAPGENLRLIAEALRREDTPVSHDLAEKIDVLRPEMARIITYTEGKGPLERLKVYEEFSTERRLLQNKLAADHPSLLK